MAVTFDAFAVSVTNNAASSPLAWAHTVGATADLILAGFALDGSTGVTPANNPLTATYAAASMTSALNWQSGGAGQTSGYLAVLSKASPATGPNNVSGSFTNTGMDEITGGSLSFITGGGSLGTPAHSDSGGASVTSGSITVATTSANSLVAVFVTNGSGGTAFTTGTSRFTNLHGGTANGGAASVNAATIPGTGGNVTVNWTQTSDFYAAVAVEVLPGAGGPAVYAPPGALPGQTWRRRFHHPQQLPAPPPAPPPPPSGSQPGGKVAYRRPARSVWGGVLAQPGQPLISGTVPPHLVVARRAAARAVWRPTGTGTVNASAAGPAGTAPGHLVIARRAAARGVWRGTVPATVNLLNGNAPGGVVCRRRPARAVIRGGPAPFPPPSGTAPDRLVIGRRAAARAVWRGFTSSTTNLPYGRQPGAGLVKRRPAARAVWAGTTGRTVNATPGGPAGQEPHGFISSRRPVGGLWGGAYTPQGNASGPSGAVSPHLTIPRRAPARGAWRGWVSATVNGGAPVPGVQRWMPHPSVSRRTAARAVQAGTVTRTVNAVPPPSGTVQPAATAPHRTRPAQRVIWRGGPVPGQQPRPATGGTVRRRPAARGQWRAGAGAPPPATTPGTPAAGKSVTTRRPPSRGQWHGTVTRTANAPPVAVPAPKGRHDVPRRYPARGTWHGAAGTVRRYELIRFTLGAARNQWLAGDARQVWAVSGARQTWTAGPARNDSS